MTSCARTTGGRCRRRSGRSGSRRPGGSPGSAPPRRGWSRWPVLVATVRIRRSRILVARASSCASLRARRSRGDVIESSVPIAVESRGSEVDDRDCGLGGGCPARAVRRSPDAGDHVGRRVRQVHVVHERAGVVDAVPGTGASVSPQTLGDLGDRAAQRPRDFWSSSTTGSGLAISDPDQPVAPRAMLSRPLA